MDHETPTILAQSRFVNTSHIYLPSDILFNKSAIWKFFAIPVGLCVISACNSFSSFSALHNSALSSKAVTIDVTGVTSPDEVVD